jgi:hypothetical protein
MLDHDGSSEVLSRWKMMDEVSLCLWFVTLDTISHPSVDITIPHPA